MESGYYRWRNKKKTARQIEDEALTQVIKEIHIENKETYGPKRIQDALLLKDIHCCLGRIRRLMREKGLYCISRKKFTPLSKRR
jgi:transposase InsO family protein